MKWEQMLGGLLATVIAVSAPGYAAAKEGVNAPLFDDSEIVSAEYPPGSTPASWICATTWRMPATTENWALCCFSAQKVAVIAWPSSITL